MIDTHCHLDLYPNPGRVINEVDKRGIFVIAVTTTPKAFLGNLRLAEGRKRIRVAVGLHPELVAERYREIDEVQKHMARTKYVGEIGVDGSPDHAASARLQADVFNTLLKTAEELGGKVLSIHSRGAARAVLDNLEKNVSKSIPILHWFTGSRKELDRAMELDCWFSVGPAMLRSRKGRELAFAMPRHRILTETDGPFGTNEHCSLMPWDVELALPIMADAWKCSIEEADQQIRSNFRELVESQSLAT
ncbi:Qat anti-phage system TatD family nuclease QatD [Rhizobium sp. NXC24]|uniref:Qat anti-phage system TatD family nuclease QatD n=1 Tax=Rhizobium sp. NXC24 TaxID=2048897 RepID=UPI000CDF38C0|nr:Qat anti-phage system TatD family nuclease QatD [Rhizobium sp. NXC24]AVA23690.1 deoxyribonuclease TatD-related protein [Rhizobium sp. NXC24]